MQLEINNRRVYDMHSLPNVMHLGARFLHFVNSNCNVAVFCWQCFMGPSQFCFPCLFCVLLSRAYSCTLKIYLPPSRLRRQ